VLLIACGTRFLVSDLLVQWAQGWEGEANDGGCDFAGGPDGRVRNSVYFRIS
jgi:hypothetical protein